MEQFLESLDETFNGSAIGDLIRYMDKNRPYKKWIMYSDYCIGDDKKPNDVVSFSIMPHDHHPNQLKKIIAAASQTDIKSKKSVSAEFISHLNEPRLFHIAIILRSTIGLTAPKGYDERNLVMANLDVLLEMLGRWSASEPHKADQYSMTAKKINFAKSELSKKAANFSLFRQVTIVSFIAGYIAYLFTKHNRAEIFGWFSDRDKLIDAYGMLSHDLFGINHHTICEKYGTDSAVTNLVFADPSGGENKTPWYDEMNRIPDHIAGTIADWNLATNECTREKFVSIIDGCFSVNPRIAIINVDIGREYTQCSRVAIKIGE